MRLQPKDPPGHANRKARRYTNDIRNLRSEGHTYETIRLALLDAGVAVSISTVMREAKRPPTQWELDHALTTQATAGDVSPPGTTHESEVAPQAVKPTTALPRGLACGNAGAAIDEANHSRPGVGWLSGLLGYLRRLRRAWSVT